MKLQIGKRYVRRDGAVTEPIRASKDPNYPFEADWLTFKSDGTWGPYGECDLVAEYPEPHDAEIERLRAECQSRLANEKVLFEDINTLRVRLVEKLNEPQLKVRGLEHDYRALEDNRNMFRNENERLWDMYNGAIFERDALRSDLLENRRQLNDVAEERAALRVELETISLLRHKETSELSILRARVEGLEEVRKTSDMLKTFNWQQLEQERDDLRQGIQALAELLK